MQAAHPDAIFDSITHFFAQSCGTGHPAGPMRRPAASFLRTVCMGNAERTAQGELFAFLKALYPNTVLEYRLHQPGDGGGSRWKNGRSIDIMVLDASYRPLCAVELKHYSRIQGSLHPLRESLEQDAARLAGLPSSLAVIQVGLYTDLHVPLCSPRAHYQEYRFLTAYAFCPKGRPRAVSADRDGRNAPGYAELVKWAGGSFQPDRSVLSFAGPAESFDCRGGTVIGRVHYLVGRRLPVSTGK
jgi:hypothetical protein